MSFAAMIGRRRQLVVPTPPDEPEEPPPSGDPWRLYEPEGMTTLWDSTFPDLTNTRADFTDLFLGNEQPWAALSSTPDAPYAETSFSQRYRAGGGQGVGQARSPGLASSYPAHRLIYVAHAFGVPAGFVFHPIVLKLQYNAIQDAAGGWGQTLFQVGLTPVGAPDSGEFQIDLQTNGNGVHLGQRFTGNIADPVLPTGSFYVLQYLSRLADPGVANGTYDAWITRFESSTRNWQSTVKTHAATTVGAVHLDNSRSAWSKLNINGYFGGHDVTVPQTQLLHHNRIYVSTGEPL